MHGDIQMSGGYFQKCTIYTNCVHGTVGLLCWLVYSDSAVFSQVNGYTKVTERLLENQVAQSLFVDMLSVPVDLYMWMRNKNWPSRVSLLNVLAKTYPRVFQAEEEILQPLSRRAFQEIVEMASSGNQNPTTEDADRIFKRYQGMSSLLLRY